MPGTRNKTFKGAIVVILSQDHKTKLAQRILKILNDLHLTSTEKIVLLRVTKPTDKRAVPIRGTRVDIAEERIADLLIREGLTIRECADIFEIAYREAIKDGGSK